MKFRFAALKEDPLSRARLGEIKTLRGTIRTPVFMPVGTLATVKTLDSQDLKDIGAQIVLGNTYHLLLRPGKEVFESFGGIHTFMNWDRPVLTDSGGFQIFSLPRSRRIDEEGASFRSYINGDTYFLSPEESIHMQNAIGSDIMMVLDQCIESTASFEETKSAMELTHRWALRSLKANKNPSTQSMFAIVQGGLFKELRKQSADFLTQNDFEGFAIGGLAVGESKNEREDTTEMVTEFLPKDRPRYLMGVGTPIDLLEAVSRGVDMFDCIIPTKLAQQGIVYTSQGEVKLARQEHRLSDLPVDPQCSCKTCVRHSRGYLHHLVKCREMLGWHLLSYHNTFYYQRLMQGMREALSEGTFGEFYKKTKKNWETNGILQSKVETEEVRDPSIIPVPKKPPRGELMPPNRTFE